jgi:hypothetical protein
VGLGICAWLCGVGEALDWLAQDLVRPAEHRKEIGCSGLDERLVENWFERLVIFGRFPTGLSRSLTEADYCVKDFCPSAPDELLVHGTEVSLGNLKVNERLALGLVPCVDERLGFRLVFGLKALALPRLEIVRIESAAPAGAAYETISLFHTFDSV